MTSYGLLVFEGAEELDFVGPWEVFTVSSMLRDDADRVALIAPGPGPVPCAKGMRVLPDYLTGDHPPLDVLLVPGGQGTRREVGNPSLIGWIGEVSASAGWVTSVCTGVLLLHEAGPARGRRVATHHAFEDTLAARERGHRGPGRPVCGGREPGYQPGRVSRNRHGAMAGGPDPRS